MGKIVVTAHAKINLFLHITGKREDGYHLLESLVAFTEYGDKIEVEPAQELSLNIVGKFAGELTEVPPEKNLVWKAAKLLSSLRAQRSNPEKSDKDWIASEALPPRNDRVLYSFEKGITQVRQGEVYDKIHEPKPDDGETLNQTSIIGAKITLTKNLPVASGIGGGSADATATLKALMQLWNIELPTNELHKILLSLGSDVPVCYFAKPAMMRGIGDEITTAKLPKEKYIVLVNPNIPLSTAEVFGEFALSSPSPSGRGRGEGAYINNSLSLEQQTLTLTLSQRESEQANHLEPAAIKKLPIIGEIISEIAKTTGCTLARMSGSGATCFGLYATETAAKSAAAKLQTQYPDFWCVESKLFPQ